MYLGWQDNHFYVAATITLLTTHGGERRSPQAALPLLRASCGMSGYAEDAISHAKTLLGFPPRSAYVTPSSTAAIMRERQKLVQPVVR